MSRNRKFKLELEQGPTVTDLANATERKRSKKRKYSKIDDLEKACDTAIVKQDKKSKGHKREAEVTVEDLKNGDGDGEKDKKRRKKIKDVAQTEVLEQSDLLKKKKQKNKTGFPDPNEDESLHDQSRKCLHYFFMYLKKLTAPCRFVICFWSVPPPVELEIQQSMPELANP